MSENNYQDKAKIAKLPKDGVHCFPANAKQISTRRIVTAILAVVFLGLSLYFFLKKSPSLPFVSKALANFNGLDPPGNPRLRIPQPPVIGNSLVNAQFRVYRLIDALNCDLRHPLLDRLRLL